MNKELLPIGTVVLLKDGLKKVMITGYYTKAVNSKKVYDYNGCVFPEGLMESVYCLFDREQIDQVFYEGLNNEEYADYIKEIEALAKKKGVHRFSYDDPKAKPYGGKKAPKKSGK